MSSLTREKAEEICQHIKSNPEAIFGQKYWQCRQACSVQIQQKDRWENRFLAVAKFRVFLLNGKSASNLKVERSFNILALRNLELLQQEQILQIGWEDRPGGTRQSSPATIVHLFVRMPDGGKTHELALELLATLKHYFPEVQRSLAKMFISLGPPSLLSEFPTLPVSTPELPCHNFRRSYVAYCDWMEQPFRDEVIWDIERIYFFHNQHELDLNDFSHLALKDQQALIGSIQFSDFFTGISADGLRLATEHIDALIQLIRRSHSLKSIQLSRCVVPKDFLQLFAAALLLNMNLPLERIRLAGIPLDDRKGLAQLATLLPQLRHLHSLSLPDCGMNEKQALILLHGIHHGIGIAKDQAQAEDVDGQGQQQQKQKPRHGFQLKALNFSGNPIMNGTELGEQLANLLALNNGAIRLLDLNGTSLQLDRLWAALKLGGIGLEILRLGGCFLAPQSKRGNSGKDSAQVARELFANFKALKELSLAGTHLNPDLLQGILSGLATNPNLAKSSVYICLDNTIVSNSSIFVTTLEQHLPKCHCIRALSLRDNSLEHETFRLLTAIGQMPGIRALDIGGGNFIGLKVNKKHAQMLGGILAELVKLINEIDGSDDVEGEGEESSRGPIIEDLSLSDSRLGSHLGVLLNALGLCRSLKRLDLSNCELGPGGARLLGKSLQLNQSLRHLSLDRNQIGPDGFLELARALRFNSTLLRLQLPTLDLTDSMMALARSPIDRSRLLMIMAEIEQSLERNGQLAVDGPTQSQLAMRTVNSLINRCDGYDVNGPEASEVKKIAFHKLGKLVAEMGGEEEDEEEEGEMENGEQTGSNGREPEGTIAGDKRAKLVENLAEQIEQMATESGNNFLHQFTERLSAQEGVEMMQIVDGAAGMKKAGKLTNGTVENGSSQNGRRLRRELNTLIQRYTSEFTWDKLFTEIDRCLCADESLKCFRLLEKVPAKVGSPARKGILIRNGGNATGKSQAAAALANAMMQNKNHNHRPVSAMMMDNGDEGSRIGGGPIVDLMSQSVMGNFASSAPGSNHANERENGDEASADGRKLVHLSKQRPKPARQNRGKKLAADLAESNNNHTNPIEEEKSTEQEIDVSRPGPSSAIHPTISQFGCAGRPPSQTSNLSTSLEQSLEQSPLMQQQRRKHQQQMEEEKLANENGKGDGVGLAEQIAMELAALGSPPPIPKKGTRESSTPPKLPPKPSPNADEFKKAQDDAEDW